jgi:hypothetical protein
MDTPSFGTSIMGQSILHLSSRPQIVWNNFFICFFFFAIELSIIGRFFNRVIRPHSVKNRIIVTAITNEPSIKNRHLPRLKKKEKEPPSAFGCVTYGLRFGGVRPPLSWYDLRLTPILNINLTPSEPIILKKTTIHHELRD